MAIKQETIILNDYKKSPARAGRHRSVSIKSEPLEHTFDDAELGRGPAQAIRDKVAAEIRSITEQAAASTIAKRRRDGRTSTRLFNDTGKLAQGLRVEQDGETFATVAPSGRLAGETAGLLERLRGLVDVSARALAQDRKVREAIQAGPGLIIRKRRR